MDLATAFSGMFRGGQPGTAGNPATTAPGQNTNPAATGTPAAKPGPANNVDMQTGLPLTPNNPGADPANQLNPDGTPKTPVKDSSPLDAFTDLFKVDPDKKPAANPLKEPLLNLDPAKLAEAVNKMNFAQGMTPEMVSKAFPNSDFTEVQKLLNGVARAAYMSSFQATARLVESSIGTNNDRFDSVLGERFRNFQIDTSTSTNPALNHAAAKPVLAALKTTIASQNPDLSASDVAKRAEDYFLAMGKALTSLENPGGEGRTGTGTGEKQEPDWLTYLETGGMPPAR